MAKGTPESSWTVAFHPVTGDHLPYDVNGYAVRPGGARLPSLKRPAAYQFTDTLEVVAHNHGRSSVTITFRDGQKRLHRMFFTEFMRILPKLSGAHIHGTWGYEKNGSNTGLILVDGPTSGPGWPD